MTTAVSIAQGGSNNVTMRNRIINGAMVIDQRNAGASITPTTNATYSLDRWRCGLDQASKFSIQQSTTAPAGFTNSILVTSLSSYSVGAAESFNISQNIEGLNCADLGWGTADAQTVTLSFRVRSSLTGTFGGSLENSAINRSYPFTYTISAANTWETKSVTIAGDTSGTWLTTNGIGIRVWFSLGAGATASGTAGAWAGADYRSATGATSVVGTSGATFYITGVQLEAGTTATTFEQRPYGTELALCQRYFWKSYQQSVKPSTPSVPGSSFYINPSATTYTNAGYFQFAVPMRTTPTTVTCYARSTGASGYFTGDSSVYAAAPNNTGERGTFITLGSVGQYVFIQGHVTADAEL